MQTFITSMINENPSINYTIHDLYASVNDIYAQFDDGAMNYEETTEILSKCCTTFVDFIARQKATEKDREILSLKNDLKRAKYQEQQIQIEIKAKDLLNIQQKSLTLKQVNKMIKQYASSSKERSVAKGIPMKYLNSCQKHKKGVYRYMFRGQSIKKIGYKRPCESIKKNFATTFAIYKEVMA